MASGQTSNLLIDLSCVLRSNTTQRLIAACIPEELRDLPIDTLGGPLSGSDLICAPLCKAGLSDSWFGVRKEPKNRGLDQSRLTGNIRPGQKVLLVEDVITTGGTGRSASQAILDHGCSLLGVFCLVDRGGMQSIQTEFGIPGFSIFTLKDIETHL